MLRVEAEASGDDAPSTPDVLAMFKDKCALHDGKGGRRKASRRRHTGRSLPR